MLRVMESGHRMMFPLLATAVLVSAFSWAQEQDRRESPEPERTVKIRGRLPAYFSAVVTPAQRRQVYQLQKKYGDQIAELRVQIAKLEMQRDKDVDAVLTPEQLAEVNAKREEARRRRAARSADRGKATDERADEDGS